MHRRFAGVLVVASVSVFAGCGGGATSSHSGLSASAFRTAADKLCATTEAQLRGLGQLTLHGTHADTAKLDQADPVILNVIKEFKALHGPGTLNAARDAFVTDLSNLQGELSSASSDAKLGDKAGYASALLAASGSGFRETAAGDGAKLGAKACASI